MKYLSVLFFLISSLAIADNNAIVKCTMADGSVIFTNQKCTGGKAAKINLGSSAKDTSAVSAEFAFTSQQSSVQVGGEGAVVKILPDDKAAGRHQRFIVRLESGQTLLVAHNIDIAPRIEALQTGDLVRFYGEYLWNEKGGLLHWTHHDPKAIHTAGWLTHKGKQYQ